MSEMQSESPSFEQVAEQRFGRRTALKAALAGAAGAAVATTVASNTSAAGPYAVGELTYDAVPQNGNDQIRVAGRLRLRASCCRGAIRSSPPPGHSTC